MRKLLLWVMALGLAGCPYRARHDWRVRETLPRAPEALSLAYYQATGAELLPGHRVELVHNGAIFDRLEQEIRAARSSIHILSYIWRPSEPSERLLRALAERQEGVECRVLVDPLGSIRFVEEVQPRLLALGCEVLVFRPLQGLVWTFDVERLSSRLHRRLVIRDGVSGVTGGFGIWRSWEGGGQRPEEWRDANVWVEGPVVREMQRAFAQNWQEAGGGLLPAEAFPEQLPAEGPARVGLVASTGAPVLTDAERMTLLTLGAARERLWVANSYFIPTPAVVELLLAKVREGVDVRVLVPGDYHDVAPVYAGQKASYEPLLAGGVRIYEYAVSMMHSKTLLADDRLVAVGSTNLDQFSLDTVEEVTLVVEDEALARELAEDFEEDLEHSVEVRWESWQRRGWVQRLRERLAWLMGEYL